MTGFWACHNSISKRKATIGNMRKPVVGPSPYRAALEELEARLARWEAMGDDEIAREGKALGKEQHITHTQIGEKASTSKFHLACVLGLERAPGDPPIRDLHYRLVMQIGRAREAAKAAKIRREAISAQGASAAKDRWAEQRQVRLWVFEQRRLQLEANPKASRAALIRELLPTIRAKAREAGEPLTGDEPAVIDTIKRWFRKAKIK